MKRTLNLRTILTPLLICAMMICGFVGFSALTAFAADGDTCVAENCGGTYTDGICTKVEGETHYQPATETKGQYDVNGDGVIDADTVVYEIGNAGQLYWFMEYVNSAELFNDQDDDDVSNDVYTYPAQASAVLTKDIVINPGTFDADGVYTAQDDETPREWFPIGYWFYDDNVEENVFYAGTFDGQGYTISGLYFNNSEQDMVGLFGQINQGGVVKNVGVINSYISGGSIISGVVGENYGGTVENCYNTGTVSGVLGVSGVVCDNNGTVKNCYNSGIISGTGNCVAGVAGFNSATIENCYNTGTVSGNSLVGGIAGNNFGTVKNCYNTGTVSGTTANVGGVAGTNSGTVTSCYYLDKIGDISNPGGITGEDVKDSAEKKTSDQFASGEVAYLLGSAWGQTLSGDNKDAFPVFNNGSNTVYQIGNTGCTEGYDAYIYSNDESTVYAPAHTEGKAATCVALAVCSVCQNEYGEPNPDAHNPSEEWSYNNGYHYYVCLNDCGNPVDKAACSGGEATCTATAECKICGSFYGEMLSHNYINGICTLCVGYQPATETKGQYDVNGDGVIDADTVVYEIGNAGQLYWFAQQVNNDNENYGSAKAVLVDDIDLNPGYTFTFISDVGLVEVKKDNAVVAYLGLGIKGDTSGSDTAFDETASETGKIYVYDAENGYTKSQNALNSLNKWTPIGDFNNRYIGTFDGQGHKISGVYINNTSYYQGLFGYIGKSTGGSRVGGTVKNVTVANSYVKAYGNVGGVVGFAVYSTVEGCRNEGTAAGDTIIVGGVLGGAQYGIVTNCYNTGKVIGDNDVGGVIGQSAINTVTSCYNTGDVSCTGTDARIGGVVGLNGAQGIVTNCYFNSDTFTGNAVGGNEKGTVENVEGKTSAQFASGEVAYLLNGSKSVAPEGETLAWYQNLNETNGDATPVLVSTGSNTVYYGYISCADDANMIYTNNSAVTETKPEHKDENADHICDNNCGKQDIAMDLHKDANKDHACDYGCAVAISEHVYDNACDTDCNVCSQTRTPAEHYSKNADGKCDECGESFKLSGGAIAGIVVGGVAVLGIGVFAIFWFVIKKKTWAEFLGIFKNK